MKGPGRGLHGTVCVHARAHWRAPRRGSVLERSGGRPPGRGSRPRPPMWRPVRRETSLRLHLATAPASGELHVVRRRFPARKSSEARLSPVAFCAAIADSIASRAWCHCRRIARWVRRRRAPHSRASTEPEPCTGIRPRILQHGEVPRHVRRKRLAENHLAEDLHGQGSHLVGHLQQTRGRGQRKVGAGVAVTAGSA